MPSEKRCGTIRVYRGSSNSMLLILHPFSPPERSGFQNVKGCSDRIPRTAKGPDIGYNRKMSCINAIDVVYTSQIDFCPVSLLPGNWSRKRDRRGTRRNILMIGTFRGVLHMRCLLDGERVKKGGFSAGGCGPALSGGDWNRGRTQLRPDSLHGRRTAFTAACRTDVRRKRKTSAAADAGQGRYGVRWVTS